MSNRIYDEKRNQRKITTDKIFKNIFTIAAILSGSALFIIVIFIVLKGIAPFLPNYQYGSQDLFKFLVGSIYRQDQKIYGIGFIIINTFIIGFLALLLAFPISVFTALFIAKIAPKRIAQALNSVIELLASIPSVVYGVYAAVIITKLVSSLSDIFNYQTAGGNSLLATVFLLAIMIFPTITALSISAIKAVPVDLEQASLALGATVTQTNFKIVLTTAKSGIFAGAILGLGRAFGEATAVSMVVGNKLYGPTFNPFDITRTLTTTMLAGLKETVGLDYDIRFSVGIVLMVIILLANLLLNKVKSWVGN